MGLAAAAPALAAGLSIASTGLSVFSAIKGGQASAEGEKFKAQQAENAAVGGEIYDGTILSLFALYKKHPASPWRDLKMSSRHKYDLGTRRVARDLGHLRVEDLTRPDMWNFAARWVAPVGGSGARRADAQCKKQVLRNALKFGEALGLAGCAGLAAELPLPRWHHVGDSGARQP